MKFSKTVCQSCASPILRDYDKGTERGGEHSEAYCRRCYQVGSFTDIKMTAEEMHDRVREKMIEMKFPHYLAELMAQNVYALKRWEAEKPLAVV
jgi:hypothetical protein